VLKTEQSRDCRFPRWALSHRPNFSLTVTLTRCLATPLELWVSLPVGKQPWRLKHPRVISSQPMKVSSENQRYIILRANSTALDDPSSLEEEDTRPLQVPHTVSAHLLTNKQQLANKHGLTTTQNAGVYCSMCRDIGEMICCEACKRPVCTYHGATGCIQLTAESGRDHFKCPSCYRKIGQPVPVSPSHSLSC
jgi:hypothetical protein